MFKNLLPRLDMLIDQLANVDLICDCIARESQDMDRVQFDEILAEVRVSWASAAFMQADKGSLNRYFSYQLQALVIIFDKASRLDATDYIVSLVKLTDHLFLYFRNHVDSQVRMPCIYSRIRLREKELSFGLLMAKLDSHPVIWPLKEILFSSFAALFDERENQPLTFGFLCFLESLIDGLLSLSVHLDSRRSYDAIINKLIFLNFNNLHFITLVQQEMRSHASMLPVTDQIAYFQALTARFQGKNVEGYPAYDQDIPPAWEIIYSWLREETIALKAVVEKERAENQVINGWEKMCLDLSVAQLACFIRVLGGAKVAATENLAEIFRLCTLHFSTKRQKNISEGSLSNQFYNKDQKSAAVIRDMLQKMILRLNSYYFPVWAVICLISYACPGKW